MKRVIRVFAMVMALLLLAALPAAAVSAKGHGFHASVEGFETGFTPGPLIPEGRCPASSGWILESAGGGEAAGYGAFTWEAAHCSRVVAPIPGGAQGKMAAGVMVLSFDEGDLTLGYTGSWKFVGDLMSGAGVAKAQQSYTVLGGTGIFDGAKGHGQIGGFFDNHAISFDIRGSLVGTG